MKTTQKIQNFLISPFLISPLTEPRGQEQFCQNLIANLFEKGKSQCTKEFPDVKIKRQLFDQYLKGICSLTSQYEIYTIEIRSTNAFHDRYFIRTDDIDIEFSKFFTQYIKSIQHQNSQSANSTFPNDVFSLTYSYLSILELNEPQDKSPTQTSRISTYNCTTGTCYTLFTKKLSMVHYRLFSSQS